MSFRKLLFFPTIAAVVLSACGESGTTNSGEKESSEALSSEIAISSMDVLSSMELASSSSIDGLSSVGGMESSSAGALSCELGPKTITIAAAGKTFSMGVDWTTFEATATTQEDQDFYQNFVQNAIPESEVHSVSFTYNFEMDETEVTQSQIVCALKNAGKLEEAEAVQVAWEAAVGMAHLPIGDNYPAFAINSYTVALYANVRSAAENLTPVYTLNEANLTFSTNYSANGYRLPTEAEWEYAARGGETFDYAWGKNFGFGLSEADSALVSEYAVWIANSGSIEPGLDGFGPHVVASKKPNAFGLYDMAGNVSEYINQNSYEAYTADAVTDPMPTGEWDDILLRGGNWTNTAIFLRSACRSFDGGMSYSEFSKGFRLVRMIMN